MKTYTQTSAQTELCCYAKNPGTYQTTETIRTIAPYWSEEKNGVVVPLLGIVIDAKNLDSGHCHSWGDAVKLAESSGKRLITKEEAVLIYWMREAINAILKEHDGHLLDDWTWTGTEYSAYNAWYVYFGSGLFYYHIKYVTFTVRAVAAF